MSSTPRKWSLNPEALERLLGRLDPDREQASRQYEALRRKLTDFFDWRGSASPDTMADETIDRVARKLEEGEAIENVGAYTHGVARRVLQESYRRVSRERTGLKVLEESPRPADDAPDDRLPDLHQCLERLPAEHRTLILAYYDGAGRAHLTERKSLAGQFGLTYAGLKTRAHRVRLLLEECMKGTASAEFLKPVAAGGHS